MTSPPTISQIKQFEDDIRSHHIRVLIYNNQVINPFTQRMRSLAIAEGIPVIGVNEIMPNHVTYIEWMMTQLQRLETALSEKNKAKSP